MYKDLIDVPSKFKISEFDNVPCPSCGKTLLPKEKQTDVARRVAMMEKPSYDVVKQVEEILQKKISYDYMNDEMNTNISGVETLTEILRSVMSSFKLSRTS